MKGAYTAVRTFARYPRSKKLIIDTEKDVISPAATHLVVLGGCQQDLERGI